MKYSAKWVGMITTSHVCRIKMFFLQILKRLILKASFLNVFNKFIWPDSYSTTPLILCKQRSSHLFLSFFSADWNSHARWCSSTEPSGTGVTCRLCLCEPWNTVVCSSLLYILHQTSRKKSDPLSNCRRNKSISLQKTSWVLSDQSENYSVCRMTHVVGSGAYLTRVPCLTRYKNFWDCGIWF